MHEEPYSKRMCEEDGKVFLVFALASAFMLGWIAWIS